MRIRKIPMWWHGVVNNVRSHRLLLPLLRLSFVALYTAMTLVPIGCLSWQDYAGIYRTTALVALQRDDYEAAEAAYEQALEIQEAYHDKANYELLKEDAVLTRRELVKLYQKTGRYSKTETLLKRAMKLETESHGAAHIHVFMTRVDLAQFYDTLGNYAEAEKVFRADLERNRHSGRSLFGLMESLKAQKKSDAAAVAQREFETAWKNADTKLTVADL